jgi:hypothetical protein
MMARTDLNSKEHTMVVTDAPKGKVVGIVGPKLAVAFMEASLRVELLYMLSSPGELAEERRGTMGSGFGGGCAPPAEPRMRHRMIL